MISGIDVATSQRNLDFGLAFRAGYRVCYVKLGGDNSGRYVAPNYAAQVDKARAAGFRVGHYWVPGATDPVGAADYAADKIHGWTSGDFFVLDDETLDSGRMYEPADAAKFLARIHERLGTVPFIYVGAAELRARDWAPVEALGVKLIVASYGANNGTYGGAPNLGGRFGNVWAGHQYTSAGTIGGVAIDLNVFQDWAFDNISAAGGKVTLIMSWTDETTNLDPNTLKDSGSKSSRDWKLSFIEAYGKRVTNWLNRRIWGRTAEQNEKYVALLAEATAQTLGIQLPVADKTGDFNTRPAAGQIKVDIAIDDKAATLIASKISVAGGATPDEVRAILQAELGALVFRPDAKG